MLIRCHRPEPTWRERAFANRGRLPFLRDDRDRDAGGAAPEEAAPVAEVLAGPVAYYEDGYSVTLGVGTWIDQINGYNQVESTNPPADAGGYPNYLTGSPGDRLSTPDNADFSELNNLTICFWLLELNHNAGIRSIVGQWPGRLLIYAIGTDLVFAYTKSSGGTAVVSVPRPPPAIPVHVAIVGNWPNATASDAVKIYLDAVDTTAGFSGHSGTATLVDNSVDLTTGGQHPADASLQSPLQRFGVYRQSLVAATIAGFEARGAPF